jgi:hypothetical protein
MTRKATALPDGNTSSQRPNLVPGVPIYAANQSINNWFNPVWSENSILLKALAKGGLI